MSQQFKAVVLAEPALAVSARDNHATIAALVAKATLGNPVYKQDVDGPRMFYGLEEDGVPVDLSDFILLIGGEIEVVEHDLFLRAFTGAV